MAVIGSELEVGPILVEKRQCFASNSITNLSSYVRSELEMYLHADYLVRSGARGAVSADRKENSPHQRPYYHHCSLLHPIYW